MECQYLTRPIRTIAPIPTLELSLLLNWTNSTSLEILPSLDLWQFEVPRLALASPYLMRLIFTLSGLHRPELVPPGYCDELRATGFNEFRQILDDGIDSENAESMIATAILLAIHGFMSDGIMRMFNGLRYVIDETSKVIPGSMFQALISPVEIPPCPETFPLLALSQPGFENAISQLAHLYSLDPSTISQEMIFTWPLLLPNCEEDVNYQVLVFWYLSKCAQCGHIWWIKEAAGRECAIIEDSIPAEYRHLLPAV